MSAKKALIAMSGGVDSTVAAFLMKRQGYDCVGCTMKLHDKEADQNERERTCCSVDDVEDARAAADCLGMPYYVFNFKDRFREAVIQKFIDSYENGRTPNPCIDCNRYLKFGRLYEQAEILGCDCVVTGHYARIEEDDGRYLLKKALDETKDQSYVLYSLTQEQLMHTRFPLGELRKAEVRELAENNGFGNADKPDSQDICFVTDGDYAKTIEQLSGKRALPGMFVSVDGTPMGQHRGIIHYTLGQRKGLGISAPEPLYVCGMNKADNTVTVGPETALYSRVLYAEDVNWIAVSRLTEPMRVSAKIRYRHVEKPAVVYPEQNGGIRVVFDEPQRAITEGQAVVLYDGELVVGGGTICRVEK